MTPANNTDTQALDITGLAVAMGRVEEKLTSMSEKESKTGERLDKIEQRLGSVELNVATNLRPKTPWYLIVGGAGALLMLALNGWSMFQLLTQLANLVP